MKKIALVLTVLMIVAAFAGCNTAGTQETEQTQETQQSPQETQQTQEPTENEQTQEPSSNDMQYEFEFKDIDGNVHKLSDYKGKPVYLLVWGSWCSVCMSELEEMNEFAAQPEDYYVLSVVFPNYSGEKSEEDFIPWYKEFEYENLMVMFDNDLQIVKDFGISGFPSNIFFDAQGNFVGGQVGQMLPDSIDAAMMNIAKEQ